MRAFRLKKLPSRLGFGWIFDLETVEIPLRRALDEGVLLHDIGVKGSMGEFSYVSNFISDKLKVINMAPFITESQYTQIGISDNNQHINEHYRAPETPSFLTNNFFVGDFSDPSLLQKIDEHCKNKVKERLSTDNSVVLKAILSMGSFREVQDFFRDHSKSVPTSYAAVKQGYWVGTFDPELFMYNDNLMGSIYNLTAVDEKSINAIFCPKSKLLKAPPIKAGKSDYLAWFTYGVQSKDFELTFYGSRIDPDHVELISNVDGINTDSCYFSTKLFKDGKLHRTGNSWYAKLSIDELETYGQLKMRSVYWEEAKNISTTPSLTVSLPIFSLNFRNTSVSDTRFSSLNILHKSLSANAMRQTLKAGKQKVSGLKRHLPERLVNAIVNLYPQFSDYISNQLKGRKFIMMSTNNRNRRSYSHVYNYRADPVTDFQSLNDIINISSAFKDDEEIDKQIDTYTLGTLLAMFILDHIHGGAILDPEIRQDTYSIAELAHYIVFNADEFNSHPVFADAYKYTSGQPQFKAMELQL